MLDITDVMCYATHMIKNFASKPTAAVFAGKVPKGFPADIANVARRKLRMLDSVSQLDELRVPPNNRLEALMADRLGQYSIRVNDRWRLCFAWRGGHAYDVEIVDYH